MKQPKTLPIKQNAPTAVALQRLVRRLARISNDMRMLGCDMEYYGGFSNMGERGRQMQGAAHIAKGWTKYLRRIAEQTKRQENIADKNRDKSKPSNISSTK